MGIKEQDKSEIEFNKLPPCVAEYIRQVIKKMRFRREVRQDVQAELTAYFEDELKDCKADEQKQQKAQQLITGFGDVKLLAVLLRRAKKRCRPLWRTIVARTFQTVGVLILCLILYAVWFSTGQPTISIDYMALLNRMNRPEVRDEDNAWPHYEKAIELYVNPSEELKEMAAFKRYGDAEYRSFGEMTDKNRREIKNWVEQNEAAWQEFVAGSLKSYCYRKYKHTSDKGTVLFNIDLSHLRTLRDLARVGTWRSLIEMECGNTQKGLENCLAIAKAGRHWRGKGAIVEQLVGMHIENNIVQTTFAFLDEKQINAELLKNIQNKLEDIVFSSTCVVDFQMANFFFRDAIQHCFTNDGKGSGHLIPGKMEEFGIVSRARNDVLKDLAYTFGLNGHKVMAYPASLSKALVSANRRKMLLKFETAYDKYENWTKMTPWQIHSKSIDFEFGFEDLSYIEKNRYVMFYNLMPSFQYLVRSSHQSKAQTEALIATLAILRNKQDTGQCPQDWEELIAAGYLKELPNDPYSDKPLVYKKTTDSFCLYSIGLNFKDDGGRITYSSKGRPVWQGSKEDGDMVFWPLPKPQVKQ